MKHMYQSGILDEILSRINQLQPSSQSVWGKMSVGQMLAHCIVGLEVATGSKNPKRVFLGFLFGRHFKKMILGEKDFNKNSPTDKSFIITKDCDFEEERQKLIKLIHVFVKNGPAGCSTRPHPFFGEMSPKEWSILMYKHLDHHLRQFGV